MMKTSDDISPSQETHFPLYLFLFFPSRTPFLFAFNACWWYAWEILICLIWKKKRGTFPSMEFYPRRLLILYREKRFTRLFTHRKAFYLTTKFYNLLWSTFNTAAGRIIRVRIYEKFAMLSKQLSRFITPRFFNDDCRDHSSSDLISTFHLSNNRWLMMRSERGEHLHFISYVDLEIFYFV